jgi:hypothetical protein
MSTESPFHPLCVELLGIPAEGRALIGFNPEGDPQWTLGSTQMISGIDLRSGTGESLSLRQLVLAPRTITIVPGKDVACLRLSLYVRTNGQFVRGHIDVRGDARVRFKSPFDETTVLGRSSWYCRLT